MQPINLNMAIGSPKSNLDAWGDYSVVQLYEAELR